MVVRRELDELYRADSRRVLATLIRLLGDFDLAEEALQEAFAAAAETWPRDGLPANPRAWLVSTGRYRMIDRLRRQARFDHPAPEEVERLAGAEEQPDAAEEEGVTDDRLRLIFTCCHPALPPEARVALTLREVCGLTTEEVARAFLVSPSAMAQRIVRAKRKIRRAGIPYEVPSSDELPERVHSVLQVVYLVFNEGYSASSGDSVTRAELSREAILLARLLVELLPEPEVHGLLALMLLHESRRPARVSATGDVVLLDAQDRTLWDRRLIDEGLLLVDRAFASGEVGPYAIQAAIAAEHATSQSAEATDWGRIVRFYDLLLEASPTPIVALNRAVAVAMDEGPEAGLALVDALLAAGELAEYHLAHAARADLCRRLGRSEQARLAYERALELATQEPERRFLEMRRAEIGGDLAG
jgi:RNA polymerase sigma-70 factor, ECF subfamily